MTRPAITKMKRYNWLQNRHETPGIALVNDQRVLAHMTPDEALQVAHNIADLLAGKDQTIQIKTETENN